MTNYCPDCDEQTDWVYQKVVATSSKYKQTVKMALTCSQCGRILKAYGPKPNYGHSSWRTF